MTTLTVQLMHARTRIAELEALLDDEKAKHAICMDDFMEVNAAYVVLRHQTQSAKDSGLAPSPKRPHQIPAHFAAAREAAMRLGRSVSVTA